MSKKTGEARPLSSERLKRFEKHLGSATKIATHLAEVSREIMREVRAARDAIVSYRQIELPLVQPAQRTKR